MVNGMRRIKLILAALLHDNLGRRLLFGLMPWSGPAKADPTAEALYDEGSRYFAEKRYLRAIDVLTKLKAEYPFSPQLTDAELKVADAYYLNEQYPEAINAFKKFSRCIRPTKIFLSWSTAWGSLI